MDVLNDAIYLQSTSVHMAVVIDVTKLILYNLLIQTVAVGKFTYLYST